MITMVPQSGEGNQGADHSHQAVSKVEREAGDGQDVVDVLVELHSPRLVVPVFYLTE